MKNMSLNMKILIGALAGICVGILLGRFGEYIPGAGAILLTAEIFGKVIFKGLLMMIIVPLVFCSIVVGISNLRAHEEMGRVWKLTIGYFSMTLFLAVVTGLVFVNWIDPGVGVENAFLKEAVKSTSFAANDITKREWFIGFLGRFLMNPVSAMAEGEIIAVVVFAVFLGIALVALGDKVKTLKALFDDSYHVMTQIVAWIMKILPYGVFALLLNLVATQDYALFKALGKFVCVVIAATTLHGAVTIPLTVWIFGKCSISKFFKGIREAMITAFSTGSSAATLPVTYRCTEENLKVNPNISGFVLPLGATVNMDGTAIYEAMAAIFIANITGIHLSFMEQCVVLVMAMVAAVGAPPMPSAGMVTMIMVLKSVGLPVEGIALLLPIDRYLDAYRTMVNVEGDIAGSVIVDHIIHKKPRVRV